MRVFAAAALAVMIGPAGLALAADRDVTLVNRTGVTLDQVFVSVAGANAWDDNVLDEDELLENDDIAELPFDKAAHGCLYDLKVVTMDGGGAAWHGVNFCEGGRIAIFWDRAAGTTRAAPEPEPE